MEEEEKNRIRTRLQTKCYVVTVKRLTALEKPLSNSFLCALYRSEGFQELVKSLVSYGVWRGHKQWPQVLGGDYIGKEWWNRTEKANSNFRERKFSAKLLRSIRNVLTCQRPA